MIPLVIDDRETRGPVPAALAALDAFAIEVRRLTLGDYLVDNTLLIERKTLPDLVASIQEGRLFDQALRLVASKRPATLILEGTSADLAGSRMRWEAIQGALVNVALLIGLPVLRSRHPIETARTLLYAAQQHRRAASGALPRRGRRPKGKAALQRWLLQGLPGVGPARAAQLLRQFGSVENVLTADAADLAEVAGIGPSVAGKIRWAVEEPPAPYVPT